MTRKKGITNKALNSRIPAQYIDFHAGRVIKYVNVAG